MRNTLLLSVLLLALVALLHPGVQRALSFEPSAGEPRRLPTIVYSTGQGLPSVRVRGRDVWDAMIVGDAYLSMRMPVDGMRAAEIDVDGSVRGYVNFDLATRPEGVLDLADFVDAVVPPAFVLLSANGRVAPVGERAEERQVALEELLARIGARAAPPSDVVVSWSLVTARRVDGWKAIAESFSTRQGTELALDLRTDLESYDEHDAPLLGDRTFPIWLQDEVARASRTQELRTRRRNVAAGRSQKLVQVRPPAAVFPRLDGRFVARVAWEDVLLGADSRFSTAFALLPSADGTNQKALFELAVDGEVQERTVLDTADPEHVAFDNWTHVFALPAGTAVDVELRVTFERTEDVGDAVWSDPALGFEVEPFHSKEEVLDRVFPRAEHRVLFLGHAYPINGYDKARYPDYMGWDGTGPAVSGGRRFESRVAVERDADLLARFYARLVEEHADRFIWGGDSVYGQGEGVLESFLALVDSVPGTSHVLVPGNHDWSLAFDAEVTGHFARLAGEEEWLDGVRLLYLDPYTWRGQPVRPGTSDSDPPREWKDVLAAKLEASDGEQAVVLFLHHAPWFPALGAEPVANVPHASSWWVDDVHPLLARIVAAGRAVVVVAGDAGDHAFADGRIADGVHYVVSGQPRFDGDLPNGVIRLRWTAGEPGVAVDVETWTPDGGWEEHREPAFPWRF